MLLKTKDGITCDACGTEYKDKFNYYSVDCSKVHVDTKAKYTTKAVRECDFDICELCWEKMRSSIIEHGAEAKGFVLICEICGGKMSGTFDYYYSEIHYVPIDKENQISGEIPDGLQLNALSSKFCLKCVQGMKNQKSKVCEANQ